MKISPYFLLLCLSILTTCQEKDPEPDVIVPPTGCDGNLSGTDCQQFFVPKGETLSYPSGTEIKATEGIEINGNILIDPAAGGDFTITATSGDIVIAGKIMIKDTASSNPSGGRYKTDKSFSRLKNGKTADGFTLTLDARGPNGNITLKKGATLFSGRGQHAPDETLTSLSGYHEGGAGGNGGLIILNAPNGKVQLPNVGNTVTQFQDEVFVLGNGGNGANIDLDANLETGELDVVEVRGGLGGNAGQLIIDADEIEGIPSLEEMETHPDFIYGGKGGSGGYVFWENAGIDKKYTLQEIIFHGGDGGAGAKAGGDGGFAYFTPIFDPISEIGDPVLNVFCYGGDGGDVFASPLPIKEAWGGNGGEYTANGVNGWDGGEDKDGNLILDGADGGSALGQGGNGGHILAGVRAYQAVGGSGGNSDQARNALPHFLGNAELGFLSSAFGVVAGDGGMGYSDCEGCRGGDGGNAGTARAIGGKGGDVLGQTAEAEAIQIFGGAGGDTWAIIRGTPGNGGNGNPAGAAGTQPPGSFLSDTPGEGGNGTTTAQHGESLGFDLGGSAGTTAMDGEYCGEDLECEGEENEPDGLEGCLEPGTTRPQIGATFTATYVLVGPTASNPTRRIEEVLKGTFTEKDGRMDWWVNYTYTYEGYLERDTSYVNTSEGWLGYPFPTALQKNIQHRCNGPTFIPPGSGECCEGTQTWSFSGCNPINPSNEYCYRCAFNESSERWIPVLDPDVCGDDG